MVNILFVIDRPTKIEFYSSQNKNQFVQLGINSCNLSIKCLDSFNLSRIMLIEAFNEMTFSQQQTVYLTSHFHLRKWFYRASYCMLFPRLHNSGYIYLQYFIAVAFCTIVQTTIAIHLQAASSIEPLTFVWWTTKVNIAWKLIIMTSDMARHSV